MIRALILGAILPALAACGGPNLITVEQSCGADVRSFVETWPCVRSGAAGLPGPYDLKNYYFRTGDMVAERIRSGHMTEEEGRLVMAETLSRLVSADAARAPAPIYAGPTTYQRVGPGTVIAY